MGHTTDLIGHLDIAPALNQDETEYLTAFSASRRYDRPGGPYEVAGNPAAERIEGCGDIDVERYHRVARGQPELWCPWVPCWDGCCLSFDGGGDGDGDGGGGNEPVAWLRYLVTHFLKPGAKAATSGDPAFEHFTFDHRVEGMVVGCRRDDRRLFSITASGSRITERVLRPASSGGGSREPLPYELARDAASQSRRRIRTEPEPSIATVVDLASRRG